MKKILILSIFLCLFASSAWSLYVQDVDGYMDVGYQDTFLAEATQEDIPGTGNSEENELAWINTYLINNFYISTEYTLDDFNKVEDDAMNWLQVYNDDYSEAANTFALDFGIYTPDYFLVKTGNLNADTDFRYFLFANDNELFNWGVIYLAQYNLLEIDAISHTGSVGGAPVPEPTTLILLGSGLIGLAGIRRKIKK